jgi:hypothetical protein
MTPHRRWLLARSPQPGARWLARAALTVLAGAFLAGCQSSSSNCGGMSSGYQVDALERPGLLACSTSTTAASSAVDPGSEAALSNALVVTSSTATTGTGTMAKFSGPLTAYVTATNGKTQLNMPATATASGGKTTTLTLNPSVGGLVPYCDVGASSAYSYWVAGPSPGQSVSAAPLTLAITWPAFSAAGTINFRCSGVQGNVPSASNSSAIETTVIAATP